MTWRTAARVRWLEIDDAAVIVVPELGRYVDLDPAGRDLWAECLACEWDELQVVQRLTERFDLTAAEASSAIQAFAGQLAAAGVINESHRSP